MTPYEDSLRHTQAYLRRESFLGRGAHTGRRSNEKYGGQSQYELGLQRTRPYRHRAPSVMR